MKTVTPIDYITVRGYRCAVVLNDEPRTREALWDAYKQITIDGTVYDVIGIESAAIPHIPKGHLLALMLKCPSATQTSSCARDS